MKGRLRGDPEMEGSKRLQTVGTMEKYEACRHLRTRAASDIGGVWDSAASLKQTYDLPGVCAAIGGFRAVIFML